MYNAHAFLVNVTKHSILALLLLLFTLLPVQADPTVINVATVERPPFVMKRGTGHIGYSIELWDAIAKELKVNYDLRVYETFPDMLNSVKNKENDLAVANITITSERERHFDFSHPIFLSGLQIMLSKNRPSGFMGTLNAILKSGILKVLGGALLILLLVAHLIWIFEWGDDKDFDDGYVKGIWDSLWWAVVTVTTVGYGDQVPRTVLGRLLALIWMLFSLFLLSVLVAQISSSIINATFDGSIAGPEDLAGHRVATISDSTSDAYLNKIGASVVGFKSTDAMFKALKLNRTDAVVFDAPVLSYFAAHDTDNIVKLVGRVFKPEHLGIALQVDSPYRDQINRALLKLSEDGKVQQIYDDWFSK
jgi:ABC-type amino acid transport substrate-binding protein